MSAVQKIAQSRKAPNRTKNIKALLPKYPYAVDAYLVTERHYQEEEPTPVVSHWVMEEVVPDVFELVMVSQAKQVSGKRGRGRPRKLLTHQEAKAITYEQAVKRGLIARVFARVRKFFYG